MAPTSNTFTFRQVGTAKSAANGCNRHIIEAGSDGMMENLCYLRFHYAILPDLRIFPPFCTKSS